MNNFEYQNMQCVSSHWLITVLKSPEKCWEKYLDPNRTIQESTDAMRFGTLLHLLLLTPKLFDDEVIISDFERKSKRGKELYNDLKSSGKTIIKPTELYRAKKIVQAFNMNSDAKKFLRYGTREKPFITPRGDSLLPLKARLDLFNKKKGLIVEFKTIYSLKAISSAMDKYNYLLSAAFYQHMSGGINVVFVFIETTEPYNVKIIELNREQLEYGHDQWRNGLKIFDKCWQSDYWPDDEVESDKIPEKHFQSHCLNDSFSNHDGVELML
jgi:hypothetical protein